MLDQLMIFKKINSILPYVYALIIICLIYLLFKLLKQLTRVFSNLNRTASKVSTVQTKLDYLMTIGQKEDLVEEVPSDLFNTLLSTSITSYTVIKFVKNMRIFKHIEKKFFRK